MRRFLGGVLEGVEICGPTLLVEAQVTSLYTSIRRAALSTEAPWDSRLEIMAAPMTCQRIGFFVVSSAFRLQVRTSSGRSIDQEMSLMDLAKSMPKGMLGLVSI